MKVIKKQAEKNYEKKDEASVNSDVLQIIYSNFKSEYYYIYYCIIVLLQNAKLLLFLLPNIIAELLLPTFIASIVLHLYVFQRTKINFIFELL